jgi:hypothetical protein
MFTRSACWFLLYCFAAQAAIAEMNCPSVSSGHTLISHDLKTDIIRRTDSLVFVKAGELAAQVHAIAKNLFEEYPNDDHVLAMQVFSASYCQLLNGAWFSDSERLDRWKAFQDEVHNIMFYEPRK